MRSDLQKLASRINGAKSLGPVTSNGKRISSLNAARRGMLSKTVLIEGESHVHFAALLAELHEEFQPLPGVETSLLEKMAVYRWRQLRLWGMEAAVVTEEIHKQKETADGTGSEPISAIARAVFATRKLTDHSRLLEFMARHESRCDRQYARAHNRLFELQCRRKNKNRATEPGDFSQITENRDRLK